MDECALHLDNCDPHATCTDTPTSFTCTCICGWSGDGVTCTNDYPTMLLVNANSPVSNGDGHCWPHAFKRIEDAMAAAPPGFQIWVAKGTYRPGTARTATYQLVNGIAVYGGFGGFEKHVAERDWVANPTILSGDVNGDGNSLMFGTNVDDLYHVVTASGTDATAVLDGFTITGGSADAGGTVGNHGGGMLIVGGSPTLANLTFQTNRATSRGGGIYVSGGAPHLSSCTFKNNIATHGGGASDDQGSASVFVDCAFNGNNATDGGGVFEEGGSTASLVNCSFTGNTGGYGAGMAEYGASATLTGCTFTNNTATEGGALDLENSNGSASSCTFTGNSADANGGAVYANGGAPTFSACTFSQNKAWVQTYASGGGVYLTHTSASLIGCTFSQNVAGWASPAVSGSGGGLFSQYSATVISGCTFDANTAYGDGGGAFIQYAPAPTITGTTFSNNKAKTGGGVGQRGADTAFRDVVFRKNQTTSFNGGGVETEDSNPTFVRCLFAGNTAVGSGGGVYVSDLQGKDTIRFTSCRFLGNSATLWGGGAYLYGAQSPSDGTIVSFVNGVFSGNKTTKTGGAIYALLTRFSLLNSSLFNNAATVGGEALQIGGGPTAAVTNSVVWGPTATLFGVTAGTFSVTSSCVAGGYTGAGNMALMASPFVDGAGPDGMVGTEDDDLHLSLPSMCADFGNALALPVDTFDLDGDGDVTELLPVDVGGNPRVSGAGLDMGAYESGP